MPTSSGTRKCIDRSLCVSSGDRCAVLRSWRAVVSEALPLTEPTALNAPADRLAAAKAAQAAREAGIKANAVKQGIEQERKRQEIERAAAEATHQSELNATKAAHLEELARQDQRWQREEAKHGSGKFWSGMATGLFVAGALVATGGVIAVNAIIGPTFDAAARARFDNQVVSTLTQERAPTTNEPRSESAQ